MGQYKIIVIEITPTKEEEIFKLRFNLEENKVLAVGFVKKLIEIIVGKEQKEEKNDNWIKVKKKQMKTSGTS